MKEAKLIYKVDIKQTLLNTPIDEEVCLPIKGFAVNSIRSTATRLNTEGDYGKFSVREDYAKKLLYIMHKA